MQNAVIKRSDASGTASVELSATAEMAINRQTQEVQGAMIIAKKFPREMDKVEARIKSVCQRKGLAEVSMYEYPRGDTIVTGASIRLAEAIAQNYGNLDFGVIELEQRHRESTVMAYAWDLETNTRQTKIFQVPHIRYSKKHGNTILTDPRDIYEMIANQGARRVRACLLGVILKDIQDLAIEECEKTLKRDSKPIAERIASMLDSFKELSITQTEIETLLTHKIAACSEREIIRLRKIYLAINDGMGKKEDYFSVPGQDPAGLPDTTGKTKGEKLATKLSSQGKDTSQLSSSGKRPPEGEPSQGPTIPASQSPATSSPPVDQGEDIHKQLVAAIKARKKVKGPIFFNNKLKECEFELPEKGWEDLDLDSLNLFNEKLMGK